MPVQEIFILSWLLWSAQYNIFFPRRTLFQLYVPIAKQPGRVVVQGRLSLKVCLRTIHGQKKEDPLQAMEEVLHTMEETKDEEHLQAYHGGNNRVKNLPHNVKDKKD